MNPDELFSRFPFKCSLDSKGRVVRIDFGKYLDTPLVPEKKVLEFVLGLSKEAPEFQLDLPPFQKKVLERVSEIPEGKVLTYGQLSEEFGGKTYSRAVGQALAKNPLPLIIPCHRIIGTNQ